MATPAASPLTDSSSKASTGCDLLPFCLMTSNAPSIDVSWCLHLSVKGIPLKSMMGAEDSGRSITRKSLNA